MIAKDEIEAPDVLAHEHVTQSVASGYSWQSLALVAKQLFQFVLLAVLARLLTPDDFGLVALILVITDFLALFNGERGFADAIIKRKDLRQSHLFSVFWLNILIGLFIGIGLFVSAPLVAAFLGEPRLVVVARVLSFNFPIYALRIIPISLLLRRMSFKVLSIIDLLSFVIGGTVAIALAITGFGIWSLVFQSLVTMFIAVFALWMVTDWRPKFVFDRGSIRELWGFSRNMIGFYVLDYWTLRMDNLLIGKFLGSAALGYYTRAYINALIPYQIAAVSRRIMRSALSKIQDDHEKVRTLYLETLSYVVMIAAPILLGLIAIAENFVLVIYGPKWLPMVVTMRYLCVVGFFLTIGSTVDSIFQSQNRTDLLIKWGVLLGFGAFSSFALGIWIGSLEAVSMFYALFLALLSYWNFTIPGWLIGLSYKDIIRKIDGYVICALIMAVIVYSLDLLLINYSVHVRLLLQLLIGIISYTSLLALVERERMKHLFFLFNNLVKKYLLAIQECKCNSL